MTVRRVKTHRRAVTATLEYSTGMGRRLVLALLLCAIAPAAARAGELTEINLPDRHDEIADKWLPGYTGAPRARVLLPDGYDPAKKYPLLVLLAGLSSNYKVWSDPGEGQVAKTAPGFPGIIVMPEGASGWYTDWYNGGARGNPAWESYELDEVIPQILRRYRIRPQRRWHALAGVSMGGLGTAYLGGRLPGFFGSIAVISGLVDGHLVPVAPVEGSVQSFIPETAAGADPDPEAVMGPDAGPYSYGHDPVRLAANLGQTRVFMAVGDGTPTSDGEPNPGNLVPDLPFEAAIIRPASDAYDAALTAAGVAHTYQPHGGIHDWANFRRELRDAISWGLFAPVDEHATHWVNDTVATHGRLWEFRYRFDAPPTAIVRVARSGDRLTVSDAGSPVTITTDGGCVIHTATPATIDVPRRACVKLRVRLAPRRAPAGRRTRVRVAVRPAVPGTVVRARGRRVTPDAAGVAYPAVCARDRITVRAPGFAPAHRTVRLSGRSSSARSRRGC
ncbi:MAG: diacylglycerol O-acyltransferase / trehalose O-mycolyltransferase [Solirubrobacteraceae bacterium]|nr:diacylglycerol O-acyltransferase / trehalose O-mycolyltransferase [Solirubrobacteraceae bacterium]